MFLLGALPVWGCARQDQGQPSTPPVQEPQAPPASPPAQQPAASQPEAQAPQATPAPPSVTRPEAPAQKKKHPRKKRPAKTQPGKVVVSNGGVRDNSAQLSPAMSKEQEQHNRESTSQLLATTDANLRSLAGRQLTPAQQSMVEQIHNYMSQSKAASSAGDLSRAHTLAYKAHLLSDELAKK